ncbi:MAG: DNA methylase [Acidobacteria bacterium]|nr:DNA methylase [Acidobacteriota bacterium]
MSDQRGLGFSGPRADKGPVECLGMTFDSEGDRRKYFLERLREKLQDPKFRKTPGFPRASDQAILRMSDPPWYTACPNPFLADFVDSYGKPYEPEEPYHREPFAVDVSVGKTDALYRAHGYHTKVPHLAIVPSILHYTKPGDVVLDGFCGSGMTGVAAQWCGRAPSSFKKKLESEWLSEGRGRPEWGARRAILGDLSPAATFIAANYNIPFDLKSFVRSAGQILSDVEGELGWMYQTRHSDGVSGRINYTVWSEVFSCPQCSGEVVFVEEALDRKTKKTRTRFPCPSCGAELNKDSLERSMETLVDPASQSPWSRIRLRPVLINYSVGDERFEKEPDEADLAVIQRCASLPLPKEVPTGPFPIEEMYHGSRLAPKGFTHFHHMFLPRAAQAMAMLWREANRVEDDRIAGMLRYFVEQAIWGMSVLNRYSPSHYSQVNRALNGVYYVASQHSEVSPWYILDGKLDRLKKPFSRSPGQAAYSVTTTGDCAAIAVPAGSVDYVFTDPPFGANIFYADLNLLVEAWHGVFTDPGQEAIVDVPKNKEGDDYQELMRACFSEYYRVLKPGRWMTVVFSNSSNAIWRAIQEAMGMAGFVVADVRTLDKKQGSYRQVTSSAVKQDLVISAYKPVTGPQRNGEIVSVTEESAWSFVREHLGHVPIFVAQGGEAEVVAERTPQVLLDRMIAFHVQRGLSVPIDSSAFFRGLERKFPKREGMYFLPSQIPEFDRKRMTVKELRQLTLFPTDEASAIQWLRQQLERKPQRQQDVTPLFHKEIHGWAKHEQTIDIRQLLEQSFLMYDGSGPIPHQIVSYLKQSSAYRPKIQSIEEHLGEIPDSGLETKDELLLEAAKDLWYVPDPGRQGDLEKAREKQLLKEFEEYRTSKDRKLKEFRTEAVRAGFVAAFRSSPNDYDAIVAVAKKLPESVLVDNQDLYTYFDVARMRLGEE